MPANTDYQQLVAAARSRIDEITPEQARERAAQGAQLVDIRDPDEVAANPSISGSVHISRGRLESRIAEAVPDKDTPVVLYCAGGGRGALATDTLRQLGYTKVANLAGGLRGWRDAFGSEPSDKAG
ncbi:rhodanese-like domain-containing protein [Pigmentiphaga soli]|uniref:Rhodanese-like domain-containing protein n=1 Tax=Pigmentiphaga soli TaxID=1007095 RepID=A0ABP8HEJ2_9BURK